MNAIPEDILAAAEKACLRPTTAQDRINNVAKAILAERDRCAEIALGWAEYEYQAGETKLASAYIWREIIRGAHA